MLGALAVVSLEHEAGPAVFGGAALFAAVAITIPSGVFWFRRWRSRPTPRWLDRFPKFRPLFDAVIQAPADLLRDPRLMARAWALQLAIFVLDAATLWIVFRALGQDVDFSVAFAGFITASVTATIAPAPGGLGTFEAGSVAMLAVLGVPVESALAATLHRWSRGRPRALANSRSCKELNRARWRELGAHSPARAREIDS